MEFEKIPKLSLTVDLSNCQLINNCVATTISVDRRTKDLLVKRKKSLELTEGNQLTWDEFFEHSFSAPKPPELSKKEIRELKQLVAEGRPWKARS